MRSTRVSLAAIGMLAACWAVQPAPGAGATTPVGGGQVGSSPLISATTTTALTTATTTATTTKHQKKKARKEAAATTPVTTVSPNTGLRNGQSVTVSVSGFPKKDLLVVLECAPAGQAIVQADCNIPGVKFLTTNNSGAGSIPFTVITGTVGSNGNQCATVSDSCQIIASEESGAHSATADLSFGTTTTTTTATTTTTTVAGGSTGNANGNTATTTSSGSSSDGSSADPTKAKDGLANTGAPQSLRTVIGVALLAILLGLGMVQLPKRSRRFR
jgi:neocarzinostatin family protein